MFQKLQKRPALERTTGLYSIQKCITLKIIQYPLSTNMVFFYKMAGVEKILKELTFKGMSPVFPRVLVFKKKSYKMTICKASDVTHFVEEISQRIYI